MLLYENENANIHYCDEGEGEPIILIHGFASNKHINWIGTGWVKTLVNQGFRVIALDNRGHGQSQKFYEEHHYQAPLMAQDALDLMDHLKIEKAHFMGYSMGARICAFIAMTAQMRMHSVVFGGLGINMVKGIGGSDLISAALLAPHLNQVKDRTGRAFRAFAEQTGSDREALASCIRASRSPIHPSDIEKITIPALVAVGTKDEIAGSAGELADLLPQGQVLEITNRDHMIAVGDKIYKQGVLDFYQTLKA